MEFSWITFILEIVNFLVLLWILKKLLYQPIKQVVIERQQAVQKVLDDANITKKSSEELQKKYTNRLQDWEKEKEGKLIQLHNEIQEEKKRQLDNLHTTLQKEKEKAKAQEEHDFASLINKKEKEVINDGLKFTATLFKQFADSNLENKILEFLVKNFTDIPEEKISLLKKELSNHDKIAHIESAYPLTNEQKDKISSLLTTVFANKQIVLNFKVNPELLAGFVISVGSAVFQANLKEELRLFAGVEFNE